MFAIVLVMQEAMAGAVRFELTKGFPLPVFKTGAIDHSAKPPKSVAVQLDRATPTVSVSKSFGAHHTTARTRKSALFHT